MFESQNSQCLPQSFERTVSRTIISKPFPEANGTMTLASARLLEPTPSALAEFLRAVRMRMRLCVDKYSDGHCARRPRSIFNSTVSFLRDIYDRCSLSLTENSIPSQRCVYKGAFRFYGHRISPRDPVNRFTSVSRSYSTFSSFCPRSFK